MTFGIVLSKKDVVAMNALPILVDMGFNKNDTGFLEKDGAIISQEDNDVLYLENIDKIATENALDYVVVISRHSGAKGIKTLSVHATGNFGEAKYGGNPRELSVAYAQGMHNTFVEMLKWNPGDYQVTLEVTHHGPTHFETPMFFAEVGPSEKEWNDIDAVEALVRSIMEGSKRKHKTDTAIGFGGGHYAPKFSKIEETIAFGHICPKYNSQNLDEEMVAQMAEKTFGGVDFAVLDEKGLRGQERVNIKSWLSNLGIEFQVL